jgi:MFS family permease
MIRVSSVRSPTTHGSMQLLMLSIGGVIVTQDFVDSLKLSGNTSMIGTVTALYDIGCFFGAIIAVMVGDLLGRKKTYGFSFVGGPISCRFPLAFQLIFIIILFGIVPWLPESPRWLIAHGDVKQARKILADLEGLDVNNEHVTNDVKEIEFAIVLEREHGVSWGDLRGQTGDQANTSTIHRLILRMGTQIMQQLSDINVTSYYLLTVLTSSVGLSNGLARLLAACNSVSYLLFSLVAIPNVECWGRKNLMMYAADGQAFCYVFATVLIRHSELEGYQYQKQVASASIAFFLYYAFFGIGWQGVPWLYPT